MSNAVDANFPFQNPDVPVAERVADLVGRMTLREKCLQTLHHAPAIERLGIPEYNWWNECLHGVGRAGLATVFPQAIGMAASWNQDLLHRVAVAISDEARAKHHEAARRGDRDMYKGLTYWTPNINIFRDPRWGRGQETYGECPFLTGAMAGTFVKAIQGDDPKYFKLVATAKHFAVHSGPEEQRHHFDATVTRKDLYETYLPAFRTLIVDCGAWSVMTAYNRTNGEPCSASRTLIVDILRDEWQFKGYVVSDCWAIMDIHLHHKVTTTKAESAAMAANAGCDLNCGCAYTALEEAHQQGLLSEETITTLVSRLMEARMRLGMFDPEERVPYASIPYEIVDCPEHRALAREMARQSMVLLKNDGILPLKLDGVRTVAVIGPTADDRRMLLGNYNGIPTRSYTPLEGIRAALEPRGIRVTYAPGCELVEKANVAHGRMGRHIWEAEAIADRADLVVMVLGLTSEIEGEQGDASNSDAAGDRLHLNLPGVQEDLLKAVVAIGKPVVLVLTGGSALAVNWAQQHVPAIVMAWYPGEEGGTALADILLGDANPAGRLPITVYTGVEQLPPIEDYAMENRTYRYFRGEPLYPFGYGLSYTSFAYENMRVLENNLASGGNVRIAVDVANTGARDGDEVVQVYRRDVEASVRVPLHELRSFRRIHLAAGQKRTIEFTLPPSAFALVREDGTSTLESGEFILHVGGQQPDAVSARLTGRSCLEVRLVV